MKKLLLGLLLSLSIPAHAHYLQCFSAGKMIYHGNVENISYADDVISFVDTKHKYLAFAFADCIVKIK